MKVFASPQPANRLPLDYMNMVHRVKNKNGNEGRFLSLSLVDTRFSSLLSGHEPVTA